MLYRISVAERGLTGKANICRSRLSGLDDLLRAGTVPLKKLSNGRHVSQNVKDILFDMLVTVFQNIAYFACL